MRKTTEKSMNMSSSNSNSNNAQLLNKETVEEKKAEIVCKNMLPRTVE